MLSKKNKNEEAGMLLRIATILAACLGAAAQANAYSICAPEIDGPAGMSAVALLVSVGFVAYNYHLKK